MVKAVYLLAISVLAILFFAVCTAGASDKLNKVEMNVLSVLDSISSVNVIVVLKNSTDKSLSIASAENDVTPGKIKYKFSSFNGFSAKLNSDDVAKLAANDNVAAVYYDRPIHVMLQDSVPLIKANDTWALQVNGTNLTGKGQTICILDTGVDYTHPDLGNCTPQKLTLNGTAENLTTPVESNHSYDSNSDYTWTINKTNYTKIAVHFVNLSLENSDIDSMDRIIIYNSNMSEIAVYRGRGSTLTNFWTPYSDGDTIYVRLTTDGSGNDYGFYIDQIRNGTTNTTYNWSACTKVIGGWDFVNNDGDPMDDYGHGTHVAGIAAANGTLKGVAPGASVVVGKIMNATGDGLDSNLIAGIEFCNNRSADYNISVISMSLGDAVNYTNYCDSMGPIYSLYSSAINNSVAKNISVVVAAGNSGNITGISAPACIQNAIPVGSTDNSDNFSSFSNRNSLVQLFAPGSSINSTWWPGGGYIAIGGTSMATPHVAGAFAIMNQYLKLTGQTKTPQQIEAIFNSTGKQITDTNYSNLTYSRIDVYAAITSIIPPAMTILSPINSTWYNGAKFNVTLSENGTCWCSFSNQSGNITMTNASSTSFYYTNTSVDETATNSTYNVTFYCNDSAGNLNSSSLLFFGVHKTIPNVTLSSPADGYSATGTTTVPFQFNVTDALNIAQCDLIIGGSVATSNSSTITNNSANTISKSVPAGTYTWSVNCTDEAGNVGNSSSRSLTINAASSGSPNNQDQTAQLQTETITILPGESQDEIIALGSSFLFSTGTETHRIRVSQIYPDSVEFIIYSDPLTFVLKVGQTKRMDLNGNGKYDIELTLLSVIGNTVNL
ncbi:MAG: S8 family serine peptidase, partial [DPANN group archaeon]|nr:S8 family serine peptidase [DPANN group archaeon]